MSLINKVLKLAQDLDNKGLRAEADVLDKFAAYVAHGDDEQMEITHHMEDGETKGHERMMDVPWMSPEVHKAAFNEIRKHFEENGDDTVTAVQNALREMKTMIMEIEEPMSEEKEDMYRERASKMTREFAGLSEEG